jgi:hypothetical protein
MNLPWFIFFLYLFSLFGGACSIESMEDSRSHVQVQVQLPDPIEEREILASIGQPAYHTILTDISRFRNLTR